MKKQAILLFVLLGICVACRKATQTTQPTVSHSLISSAIPTQSPSQPFTSLPSPTLTQILAPTSAHTSAPLPENNLVLERVAQIGGSINGITVVGDVAYVGMGPRVVAIDISQHESPRLIAQSQPQPGLVTQLLSLTTTHSPQLVVSAGKYLILMDISDPEKPVPIHQLELPGAITAMVLDASEGILYAGGLTYQAAYEYSGFIASIDTTQEDGPRLLDSVVLLEQPISLALGEGSLFAGTESYTGGLYHIQIETPGILSTPHLVISSSTENYFAPYSMEVIGDRLYVGTHGGLQAYDITDPEQPVQVWKAPAGVIVMGFSIYGEQFDVFGWTPAGSYLPHRMAFPLPEPVTGFPMGEVASLVAIHNGDFLVAYRDLEIFDLKTLDPKTFDLEVFQDLKLVGSYRPPVISVLGAAIDEHAVYVVDGGVGDGREVGLLRVFSLPDLEPLGQVTTGIANSWGWFSGIAIEGNRAYLSTIDGLLVYDLSSPVPTLLGTPEIGDGRFFKLAAIRNGDQRLLFATQEGATDQGLTFSIILTTYDLTDLQNPIVLSSPLYLEQVDILQMTWNGSSLFALGSSILEGVSDQLYIIDFKNNTIALRGSLPVPGRVFSMAVDNDLIVLAGTEGLSIVSATDPASPQLLALVPLPDIGGRVSILGNKALVVTGGFGGYPGAAQLLIFDLHTPADPLQVQALDIAFNDIMIGPMPVSEPYIVLAGGSSGIDVLEYHQLK